MQMFHEKTLEVQIVTGGQAYPGRIYLRLNEEAHVELLAIDTAAPNAAMELQFPLGEDEENRWLPPRLGHALADVVFPRLPADTSIILGHSARVRLNGAPGSLVKIQETMSTGLVAEDYTTVRFVLTVTSLDDHGEEVATWNAADDEEIDGCLWKLAREDRVTFEICHECRHAATRCYGGEDARFGLYCFRDSPGEAERLKHVASAAAWNAVAWSHVDAFHSCPSFEMDETWLKFSS